MRVAEACRIAIEWVDTDGSAITGYRGAWFAGSICWMHGDEELNPSSDVDITIMVSAEAMPEAKPGKFRYRGVLLDITLVPDSLLTDGDIALNAAIASSIARDRLIDDPAGVLRPWFDRVGEAFRQPATVIARIHAQSAAIRQRTASVDPDAPFHRQILWIFPATLATSLPVLADLGNPTVRKRFLAAREVLHRHGFHGTYERLLAVYGFDRVTPEEATTWLAWLSDLYDLAQDTPTNSAWRQDVDRASRAVSIDGTRDLIEAGNHREAIWWIVATFARALDVLDHATVSVDATLHADRLHDITDALGIGTAADLTSASRRLHAFLPDLERVAIAITAGNAGATRVDPHADRHPATSMPNP